MIGSVPDAGDHKMHEPCPYLENGTVQLGRQQWTGLMKIHWDISKQTHKKLWVKQVQVLSGEGEESFTEGHWG